MATTSTRLRQAAGPTEFPLNGDLIAVSCTGPRDCTAVGGDGQPFYVTESAGTWGTPTDIPITGEGDFQGVSCTSAGNCTAVGDDDGQPFYATETNGTWGTPTEVPATGGGSFVGVSCTTAVDCTAVGNTSSPSRLVEPLYAVESDGTWGTATEVTPATFGSMNSVSCTGAAYCTAVAWDTGRQLLYANSVDEQAPTITSPASASTGMRSPFSFTVTTTGAPTPAITEKGALPTGVTFIDNGNGTASLKGTARLGGLCKTWL